jgi:hypothetical protein
LAKSTGFDYAVHMKRFLAGAVIGAVAVYAFGAQVVKIVREPGVVAFSLQKGYGVQKEAKNELTFTSIADGKQVKKITSFAGTTASEDKKYFSKLNSIQVPVGTGKVRVTGRIFYCSFEQKFCSVQKIDEEI